MLKSTPDDAVVSLDMIVLLMMFTFRASCRRDASAVPACDVVDNDVVGHGDVVPAGGVVGKLTTSEPLMFCKRNTTTAAAFRRVAHDQVSIDDQAGTNTVTRSNRARLTGHAILVRGSAAGRIDVGRTHDQQSATVGRDRRVGALVEHDRVVLDVAVVDESK